MLPRAGGWAAARCQLPAWRSLLRLTLVPASAVTRYRRPFLSCGVQERALLSAGFHAPVQPPPALAARRGGSASYLEKEVFGACVRQVPERLHLQRALESCQCKRRALV